MILAILVPSRYRQMVVRAAEYGNSRIVVGAHYAMDVIGGRATSLHALAHLLANDPTYVGQIRTNPAVIDPASADTAKTVTLTDYPAVVKAARAEIDAFVTETCGADIVTCAAQDQSRFKDEATNAAFYASTLTYGLPVVHPAQAAKPLDIAAVAPEAGHLLTAAFPEVTLAEANRILTETQGPGGGFLDDGSEFGAYSRINLYEAAGKVAAWPRAAGTAHRRRDNAQKKGHPQGSGPKSREETPKEGSGRATPSRSRNAKLSAGAAEDKSSRVKFLALQGM